MPDNEDEDEDEEEDEKSRKSATDLWRSTPWSWWT
jgi:hypothetical protein